MKTYISLVLIACLGCKTKELNVMLNVTIKEEHVHFVELESVAIEDKLIMGIVDKLREV